MPQPNTIEEKKQLLVEGNDQRNFFEAFIKHLNRQNVQIQNFGGVNELRGFLRGFIKVPDFHSVESIGIVRDAETNADGAFQSVVTAIEAVGLPIPERADQKKTDYPRVSVLILPDGRSPGMLETLLNRSFADDSVNGCIDVFFQCVNDLPNGQIQRPEKARTHAYLSTRPEPQFSVGVAAKNNYWDLDHKEFEPIRSFLAGL